MDSGPALIYLLPTDRYHQRLQQSMLKINEEHDIVFGRLSWLLVSIERTLLTVR